ncbi:MAG: hypothetical protein U0931_36285 [Vulcanimicrobiota bacterium]
MIAVALLAVLTVGTASSVNVQMLARSENAQNASLLADSAIQQALAQLMNDPTWGDSPNTRIQYAGPSEDSDVLLTFDRAAGVPFCTKNGDDNPKPAWSESKLLRGGLVPGKRMHLVAVARSHNVRRTREAVVYVPNFTLSLGATGKVHLIDSVVGCLDTAQGIDLDAIASDPSKLKPGDLGTNSADPMAAVLEQGSRVVGNLQAGGGVNVKDTSTVGGEVRSYHGSTELPHFDFAAYDPASGGVLNYNEVPPGFQGDQNLTGVVRCGGPNLTINGDLNMDNCLFYVNGSLTVTGSVRGSGAVVVTGSTTIKGGSGLTSADSVALLSQGDLSLVSPNSSRYVFQGLAYTRGDFRAKNFTVVGGFVADGLTPAKGNVEMEGALAIRIPMFTDLNMYFPVQAVLQLASTANPPTEQKVAIKTEPLTGKVVQEYVYGISPAQPDNFPSTPEIFRDENGQVLSGSDRPPSYAAIATPWAAARFNNGSGGNWGPNPWWNPVVVQIRRQSIGGQDRPVFDLIWTENNALQVRTFANPSTAEQDCGNFLAQLGSQRCPGYFAPPDHPGVAQHSNAYQALLSEWSDKNIFPSDPNANISFDPNRFLKDADKLRIAAWTEY